jgi:uncharacterized protein (DUF427 family)
MREEPVSTPQQTHIKRRHRARKPAMKIPGPDHPISISPNLKRVRVSAGGVVIADTTRALTLKEASYPAVHYIPREDAHMELLSRTERTTHCPYKGDANYFSLTANGKALDNAVWTYEAPFPAMEQIAGYLAFYPDKVTVEQV